VGNPPLSKDKQDTVLESGENGPEKERSF